MSSYRNTESIETTTEQRAGEGEGERSHDTSLDVADAGSIEQWLVQKCVSELGMARSEVNVEHSFARLGIDSVTALELMEDLEQALDVVVSPRMFYECPNIQSLARHLAGRCAVASAKPPESMRLANE